MPFDPHAQQSPAGQPGPGGVIDFTVQGSVLTNNMVAPTVTINGHRVNVPTGGNAPIPAPPGRHHIEVYSQWLRRYGQAAITVDVQPGQRVPVFYAAPFHQFSGKGAIGLEPQKRPGLGGLLAIIGVFLLIIVLIVAVPLLAG